MDATAARQAQFAETRNQYLAALQIKKQTEVCGLVPNESPVVTRGVDPKGEIGKTKLPLGTLPWAVILEASLGLGEGAIKYGPHNWRASDAVEVMTYIEAAQRHLISFILGEDIDPASGIPHVTKAISSLMVVRDAQIHGASVDNRPAASAPGLLEALGDQWADVRVQAKKARALMDQQDGAS